MILVSLNSTALRTLSLNSDKSTVMKRLGVSAISRAASEVCCDSRSHRARRIVQQVDEMETVLTK